MFGRRDDAVSAPVVFRVTQWRRPETAREQPTETTSTALGEFVRGLRQVSRELDDRQVSLLARTALGETTARDEWTRYRRVVEQRQREGAGVWLPRR